MGRVLLCECGECRICRHREASRRWSEKNREAQNAKARQKWLERSEEMRARKRTYYQKTREKVMADMRRRREENPERYRARTRLNNALRLGHIERQPCEVCGARAEAHHEDYDRPLDVRWLCRRHHIEAHLEQIA